ncbi:hypothetical protein TRAPUB_7791 [Trametes pubescens]|uniref:Uncharacterized protein n=1 Tax=Trametes pubescens TaxID=154538 RepID=A0A1M2V2C3_TRAPU|nr:hypothetical protein TRAPUB_7791 [Trametes pubescens]
MLNAGVPGGPKLIGFDLNGTNVVTITFPATVVAANSSPNDVRFDLRGEGFACITDDSPQRPGIVVVNLSSGQSRRHLDNHPSAVSPESGFIPFHNGAPTYLHPPIAPNAITFFNQVVPHPDVVLEGLAVGDKPQRKYPGPAVQDQGGTGSHADGLEPDDQRFIYLGAPGKPG